MLPALSAYSSDELERAGRLCPAIGRYLRQLETPASTPAADLRLRRHRRWLEAALATALNKASAAEVCRQWSASADELLQSAWRLCGLAAQPAALLALGKLGAQELNLSSDVDVIIVAEDFAVHDVEQKLKEFRQLLAGVTEHGFALRLDFDLRPGGRFGPLITTPKQITDYYWSQGETWERLAWIRMRPIVGAGDVITACEEIASRYCYRRFLDYTLLDDLKALRSRIHRSFSVSEDRINLKLSVGGIRDIELFVHSQLVIHGGRRPELRTPSTDTALDRLKDLSLLQPAEADFLKATYWRFREIENQIQAYEDRQSHSLDPGQPFPQLTKELREEVQRLQASTDTIVSSLLGKVDLSVVHLPEEPGAQARWLESLGFSATATAEIWPQLMSATALSRRSESDELARREFLFRFVLELRDHGVDYDLGLRLLADFVRATRAKASFFTLLLREPRLIRDLARLFSISPYLGQIVASRPELIDSFVLRAQESFSEDWDKLLDEMAERRLLSELISASQFFDSLDVAQLGQRLSATADEICLTLMTRLGEELNASGTEILALGKWGGQELGFRSDLDFIFVAHKQPTEADHRLARRFISRLTDAHRGGKIYSVDLRLRPSGAAGPLMITRDALESYLLESAAAWERQSYLRGRFVSGQPWRGKAPMAAKGLSVADRGALADIRGKLLLPSKDGFLDVKLDPGGLAAIEFTTQIAFLARGTAPESTSTLRMIEELVQLDQRWSKVAKRLRQAYLELRMMEQLFQLTSSHSGSALSIHSAEFHRLATLIKSTGPELESRLRDTFASVQAWLAGLDPLTDAR